MEHQHSAIEENVALLALFNPKFEALTRHALPSEGEDCENVPRRTLTLKDEKKAAEAFAVLFATTDSPDQVGAVCVEETSDGRGLTVRTATNSGPRPAQTHALRSIAQSLKANSGNDMTACTRAIFLTLT